MAVLKFQSIVWPTSHAREYQLLVLNNLKWALLHKVGNIQNIEQFISILEHNCVLPNMVATVHPFCVKFKSDIVKTEATRSRRYQLLAQKYCILHSTIYNLVKEHA